ncbi:MAG: hypothetical protein K9K66_10815 [Desulfarculaceae bacterium]|nr:hypothetical protein [Desulfarculaceae bacterium]MCF8102139.1 hypothetical protein [Desulfarculaceae bacterium]MCF8118316.1 hypothetical protein [Desulfarculaceae bacterium]
MAKKSKWGPEDRKKLLKMIKDGMTEQTIRDQLAGKGQTMTSSEFAQQLKMAMVESGAIKQASKATNKPKPTTYGVTKTGRLTITDFGEKTGLKVESKFTLEKPRGRSKAWRLVPV